MDIVGYQHYNLLQPAARAVRRARSPKEYIRTARLVPRRCARSVKKYECALQTDAQIFGHEPLDRRELRNTLCEMRNDPIG